MEAGFHQGFEFDYMAQRPMYAVCPQWLLEHCAIDSASTVGDIGCGSGIFTRFVLDRFPNAPNLRIVAVDPSEFELSIMRSRINDHRVTYIQGRAQDAARLVPAADAAVLCNVLHQIPLTERAPVLRGVFELLRSGGMAGANTLFYDGAVRSGTEQYYVAWMMHARNFLKERGVRLKPPEATPVALQVLSPEQHAGLLAEVGFVDIELEEIECEWSPEDWMALSRYSVFIQGALHPGIDLALGSQALIEGARSAYRDLGLGTVKRGWLQCAARRP